MSSVPGLLPAVVEAADPDASSGNTVHAAIRLMRNLVAGDADAVFAAPGVVDAVTRVAAQVRSNETKRVALSTPPPPRTRRRGPRFSTR